MMIGLLESQVW